MNSRNYLGFAITISLMFTLSQQFEWSSSEEDSFEGTPLLSEFYIVSFFMTTFDSKIPQRFTVDAYSTRTNIFQNASYISRCARICSVIVTLKLNLGRFMIYFFMFQINIVNFSVAWTFYLKIVKKFPLERNKTLYINRIPHVAPFIASSRSEWNV